MRDLKDLRGRELSLNEKITSAGLVHLAGMTHLAHGMKRLKQLVLKQTAVTDAGITALQQALPECRVER